MRLPDNTDLTPMDAWSVRYVNGMVDFAQFALGSYRGHVSYMPSAQRYSWRAEYGDLLLCSDQTHGDSVRESIDAMDAVYSAVIRDIANRRGEK